MTDILWNFVVYRFKISDVSELKTRLIDEWAQFRQSIVYAAVSQRHRCLNAFVSVRGHTLNTYPDSFETNL